VFVLLVTFITIIVNRFCAKEYQLNQMV